MHALESYVLTPIIQRQALDIPPATLFAFQILLGVVFGIWGLALALPLMAIAKVMIDHFKAEDVAGRDGGLSERQPAVVSTVSVCSTSGGAAKYCPTSPRHAVKSSEPRKSTVWFSSVSHLRHQPVTLRLLDRFVQLKALAALGAQEQRTRLGDGRLKILLGAGLDVDLCDFGDHLGYAFS